VQWFTHPSLLGWGVILDHSRRPDARHTSRAGTLKDMMNRRDRLRTARILVAAAVLAGSLGACTASHSGGGPTASSGERTQSSASAGTTSLTPTPIPSDEGLCTTSSIEGALPKGSVLVTFDCTIASPAMWAAARVKTGSVFFLTSVSGPWTVTPGNALCGARRNEVPEELRSYCG
jgi:hypothetical protein